MENNKKKFIKNPKGFNQWNLRSLNEIQKITDSNIEKIEKILETKKMDILKV